MMMIMNAVQQVDEINVHTGLIVMEYKLSWRSLVLCWLILFGNNYCEMGKYVFVVKSESQESLNMGF